ncbi:MAG TPA: hypothetical protein VMT64_03075 [Candidatus Binataceae bacterium]|nr:hypothetical protein [Candidatus Binataceae bacterium]
MTSALDITRAVKAPRAVFVNFPLGHQTGRPNDPAIQRAIVRDAMRAFETIATPGEIVELPYVWDPHDRAWETKDYTKGFMPTPPSREDADLLDAQRVAKYAK